MKCAIVVCSLMLLMNLIARGEGEAPAEPRSPTNAGSAGASPSRNVASEPYVWKNVAIYGGGFVTGIITHPKEKGLIYCRTDIGGAYRWDAKEQQWIPLNDWVSRKEGNLLGIESLAIDPNDPDRLYIAAGTYSQSKDVTSILRSSDRGKTFQRSDVNLRMGGNDGGRPVGERLAVDPNDGNILFFGSRDAGLWTSTDRAATWKEVESFPTIATDQSARMTVGGGQWGWPVGISFVQFDPKNKTIYAGVCTKKSSLYRSRDGGQKWEEVERQPTGLRPNHVALSSDGWLYISYADEPGPHEMHDGAIWKLNTASGEWVDVSPIKPGKGDEFGYGGVSIDAADPNTLVACTFCRWAKKDQVFRSTDAGKTWKGLLDDAAVFDHMLAPYTKQSKPHWLGDVEIDPFDPTHILFVTGYGIWASHGNLTNWIFEDKGLEEIACLDLISPPEGAHLVSFIGDVDGFRHDDLDQPSPLGRHKPEMGTNRSGDFAALKPTMMVRTGDNKPFAAWSPDGGSTWNAFESIPQNARGGTIACSPDFSSIIWSPDPTPRRAGGGGSPPRLSRDRGKSWTPCAGLAQHSAVISDRVDPQNFYALARGEERIDVSTDAGATFKPAAGNLPDAEHRKLAAVFGQQGDLWLCAESKGLFHTTDAGKSLGKIANVKEALAVGFGKAAPGKSYPAVYLVGTVENVEGVFRSDDAGRSWTRINDDQHQYAWIGQCVIGDPRVYGRVYLATNGRGILYADPLPSPSGRGQGEGDGLVRAQWNSLVRAQGVRPHPNPLPVGEGVRP